MDLHVIIVIACVFLASLFSILFINKFFKSKTYEEAAAEKRALVDKLYPSTNNNKIYKRQTRNKQLLTKKDKKRQQKQQQQQQRETTENDSNDSDNQSVDTKSIESSNSPSHSIQSAKKLHVEFSEPEIINEDFTEDNQQQPQRRSSDTKINSTTTNIGNIKQQQQKRNKIINTKQLNTGILINKNESINVKEPIITTSNIENLNHFDIKQPKDVIELKKSSNHHHHSDTDINKQQNYNKNLNNQTNTTTKKSNKSQPKILNSIINGIDDLLIKNDDDNDNNINDIGEKQSITSIKSTNLTDSPKNTKSKNNHNSKNKKDKELLLLMEKINFGNIGNSIVGTSSNNGGSIGVNCIMSIVSNAELNRNDIQILIDYLLNKQQDTITVTPSEWSDDIVQKLRKQLNEKEKQLQEEQEASIGLQGKLRDLRTEINTERAHINITNKSYLDDISMKKNEIQNLNQELQNLNEKLQIERQQFKLKLHHEKQTNSQELLQQIQQLNERINLLQNDLLQKQTIINELQLLANTSHQTNDENNKKMTELNDLCKKHVDKIIYLEKCLNDNEKQQLNVRQQYDIEMVKIVENEKDSNKVELRNLQNALDSTKAELNLTKSELLDSKQNINILTKQLNEQQIQFGTINNQCQENNITTNDLKNSLNDMKKLSDDKDKIIAECELRLKELITHNDELMKTIKEQKDKNNELRTKNWKLVDALNNAETTANYKLSSATANSKKLNNLVVQSDPIKEQQNIRNLLQRLYPNEIKKITELTIDEFVDYINIAEKHNATTATIPLNKATTITNATSEKYNLNNHNTSHNHNNNINTNKIELNNTTNKKDNINTSNNNNNNNNSNHNTSCSSSSSNINNSDTHSLLLQNVQLRTHIDELTKIVTKTENMLINLETQAREQDAHWRNVVQSKQEEINLLKTINGESTV